MGRPDLRRLRRPEKGEDKFLGPLEAEVMDRLWKRRSATVRDIVGDLARSRELAYTTVMTIMSRLVEKEILSRTKQGRGYVYEAAASDPAAIAVRGVMRDFGDAAWAHFVDEARADPAALRRLQRLLDEDS